MAQSDRRTSPRPRLNAAGQHEHLGRAQAPVAAPDCGVAACIGQSCVSGFQAGGAGSISTSSPHALQLDGRAPACARGPVPPTGGGRDVADRCLGAGYCRSDRGRRPHERRHTGDRGTGSALSVGESVRSPQPVPPADTAGLRPGGWCCWMCGKWAGLTQPQWRTSTVAAVMSGGMAGRGACVTVRGSRNVNSRGGSRASNERAYDLVRDRRPQA
jgi:hypothetical protein